MSLLYAVTFVIVILVMVLAAVELRTPRSRPASHAVKLTRQEPRQE